MDEHTDHMAELDAWLDRRWRRMRVRLALRWLVPFRLVVSDGR